MSRYSDDFDCIDVTAVMRSGSVECDYFSVDRYRDFNSFSWETDVEFVEFLRMARLFVRNTSRWVDDHSYENTISQSKHFSGLYFHLHDSVKQFKIEKIEHLDPDFVLPLIEPHWNISFVRIALPYGDLCYDLEITNDSPQRAGIVSHIPCVGPIADLIHWTHAKYVPRKNTQDAVRTVFSLQNWNKEASGNASRNAG